MIDGISTPHGHRRRFRFPHRVSSVAAAIALLAGTLTITAAGSPANAVADDDWLGIVNTYRAMSGLSPVSANASWSAEAQAHSCYMLHNGISHDEIPGHPGYTPGGDIAGNSGNVAVSSSTSATARNHIDLWMTGPFHAIGILRPNLTSTGYGGCANASTPTWHSAGTLDVLRGLQYSQPRSSTPIVFPGNGATVPVNRFIAETPNPKDLCGWTGNAGLPLIAMMPNDVSSANAALTGPDGPIGTCVLHEGNTGASPTAKAILGGDNAIVVMPRDVLVDGVYTVTVNSDGGNVSWTFNVKAGAPLDVEPPVFEETAPSAEASWFDPLAPYRHVDTRVGKAAVRLRAGKVTKVDISSDPSVTAVSANFVAVLPNGHGYLTLYNCTTEVPTVSTIGYGPGDVVANQAIVPLQNGKMCLYSKESVDVVVDVNGVYRVDAGSGFVPTRPSRLLDTRATGQTSLPAGKERVISVAGAKGVVPASATAAAFNITAVLPDSAGYVQVYPCGSPTASQISSINFTAHDVRPNTVVAPISDTGTVCVRSTAASDLTIDLFGYFDADGGLAFVPLDPTRFFDSRSPYEELNTVTTAQRVGAGHTVAVQIAGNRGVPDDARAVSVNLTAVQPIDSTFVTVFPCGSRPSVSNVNIFAGQQVVANGAMVKLSSDGKLCIYTKAATHVVVDVNGIWR